LQLATNCDNSQKQAYFSGDLQASPDSGSAQYYLSSVMTRITFGCRAGSAEMATAGCDAAIHRASTKEATLTGGRFANMIGIPPFIGRHDCLSARAAGQTRELKH
ncbi:MAG: hypothetical protein L0211_04095, partial [Planctomycetaceae bacterium]|nr:hypothetical protein [Planctomycetaceae bacterium]